MQKKELCSISLPLSRIVMGTGPFLPEHPRAFELLDRYYELGGNVLDTAHIYRTEDNVGKWIRSRSVGKEVVIITKGGHTPDCYPEKIQQQVDESLDHLQVDCIDLYFLHRDNLDIPVDEFVDCMDGLVKSGKVTTWGGSNWSPERIDLANTYAKNNQRTPMIASSPYFSLAEWNAPPVEGCLSATEPQIREWYHQHQFPMFAWSAQALGFFSGRVRREDAQSPEKLGLRALWLNDRNFQRLERCQSLAQKKGTTSAVIGLAYVLSQPFPSWPVIGASQIEQLDESMKAIDIPLTFEECAWLNLETDHL